MIDVTLVFADAFVDLVVDVEVVVNESVSDDLVTADSLATASQVRQQHNDSLGKRWKKSCPMPMCVWQVMKMIEWGENARSLP